MLETRNVAGQKLFQLLVAPAIGKLAKGSRVIVIPDGSLYGLNFEALLVPTPDLHYWIDDAVVSNANSLVLLGASATAKSAGPGKLLLVGDPIPASDDFPKLPQAESEMKKQVESYFPSANSTVYSNASATPDAYLDSHPDQFSFIHFVAHGTASLISPLDSAVILTKQGDSGQTVRARHYQAAFARGARDDLRVSRRRRAHLFRGRTRRPHVGVPARRGARRTALWEVDDNSTPQLMNRLYAGLSKGASPETALRDAKLALVHSDSIYKKPFYWAPFQIYRGP